jgi:Group 4 capsule polysaccharide lipoprotein gfcB, YjbF
LGQGLAVTLTGKIAAAIAVLALLAGCGNDKSGPNPVVAAIGGMAKNSVAKMKGDKAGKPAGGKTVTPAERRAKLEEAGKPILRVASTVLGQTSLMTVADMKGDVITWKTPDGATFSQRNGVLIQSRGLGADLMSADVPSVAQLRSGARYQRLYFFLGPDDQGTRRTYDCTATVVGKESIEIMARSYATTHVTETCERPLGTLTNEYWIEGASIRKSRQFLSGSIGYVDFERVID